MAPRTSRRLSSNSTSYSPSCPASDTGPGAGSVPVRSKMGLRAAAHPARQGGGVGDGAQAGGHGEGAVPPWAQPADAHSVEQLLGAQQHPAPHLEHRVDSVRVERRLPFRLRSREQLPHRHLHRPHPLRVVCRGLAGGEVVARRRQREPRVGAAVDEQGRQAAAKRRRRAVDGEDGERQVASQSSLRPLAKARNVSLTAPLPSCPAQPWRWCSCGTQNRRLG
jgi:hypothetical protein